MRTIYVGADLYQNGALARADVSVSNGVIEKIGAIVPEKEDKVVSLFGKYIFPGFADVHVHLREPGFSYKETIFTGSRAAAKGGYTLVGAMPNVDPPPDSLENLRAQLEIIRTDAAIEVVPYGTITRGRKGKELSDMDALAPFVIGFSDDGSGVDDALLMAEAMKNAKRLNKIIAAHSEVLSLVGGGVAHEGAFAKKNGLPGISSESEWRMVERDIQLSRETGSRHHVCHISAKETVALIRRAKREGADITCETAPHYLIMNDAMLKNEGRYKMNPPIRSEADRQALLGGILDGTIDMIATDHAPHAENEKRGDFMRSAMGVTGIETAFQMMYTHLVKPGILPLSRLIDMMAFAPRRRFGFADPSLREGARASFCVFDPNARGAVKGEALLSMGKYTPFEGYPFEGEIIMTVHNGNTVYNKSESEE